MPMLHIYQKECSQGWETFTFCICSSYCIKHICTMNISVYLHNWQCVSSESNFNLLHVLAVMWGSVALVICVDPSLGETILRGKCSRRDPAAAAWISVTKLILHKRLLMTECLCSNSYYDVQPGWREGRQNLRTVNE